jgi:hypothetical protein
MTETKRSPPSSNSNVVQTASSSNVKINVTSGPIGIPVRHDGWIPNPRDLSTTPGGTIYATTPGGTKIVYDRNQLLFLRQSPLSKTPPINLACIPGVTCPITPQPSQDRLPNGHTETQSGESDSDSDEKKTNEQLFPMEE